MFIRKPFDKTDAYFVVGSDTTHVFSSARAQMVSETDQIYVEWKKGNGIRLPVQSFAALYDFFVNEGMMTDAILSALSLTDELTPAQMLSAKLSHGIDITWTNAPDLNGRYSVGDAAQFDIMAVTLGVLSGMGFPGNTDTVPWADLSGTLHVFGKDQFVVFASAVRDYVAALRSAAASVDPVISWPSDTVTVTVPESSV